MEEGFEFLAVDLEACGFEEAVAGLGELGEFAAGLLGALGGEKEVGDFAAVEVVGGEFLGEGMHDGDGAFGVLFAALDEGKQDLGFEFGAEAVLGDGPKAIDAFGFLAAEADEEAEGFDEKREAAEDVLMEGGHELGIEQAGIERECASVEFAGLAGGPQGGAPVFIDEEGEIGAVSLADTEGVEGVGGLTASVSGLFGAGQSGGEAGALGWRKGDWGAVEVGGDAEGDGAVEGVGGEEGAIEDGVGEVVVMMGVGWGLGAVFFEQGDGGFEVEVIEAVESGGVPPILGGGRDEGREKESAALHECKRCERRPALQREPT